MVIKPFIVFLVVLIVLLAGCGKETVEPKKDVANPVITPGAGTFNDTVEVSITCETEDAVIRYTLDNSDPVETSAIYTERLSIATTTTIKAKAFKDNWNPSAITTARIVISRSVQTPVISPAGGEYNSVIEVEITSATEDAEIYYTSGQFNPTNASTEYTGPITIDRSLTIKAIAYKDGWITSGVVTAAYNFALPAPVLNPPPGYYIEPQVVTITLPGSAGTRLEEATIRYTLDGSQPRDNSLLYTEPIRLENHTTIRAIAFKEGWTDSPVAGGYYELDLPVVVNPVFDPLPGTFFIPVDVTITSAIEDAAIYYTANGSEPTQNSTLYTSPIHVSATATIKAKAFLEDWYPSEVVTATYTISTHTVDMISVPAGNFRMGDTQDIGEFDEIPVHTVSISAFKIGKYLVKQSEWTLVMGNNPSQFAGVDRPVENISWFDAIKFCNKLSIMSGLAPVYSVFEETNPDLWQEPFEPVADWSAGGYRLPTEAEWEFAARGGVNDPDYRYAGSDVINIVAWYVENSSNTTRPVGRQEPNGLNLYDMSGNVWEWCWDWYSSGYYSISPDNDPKGPAEGTVKVRRGGAWNSPAPSCRVVNRSAVFPSSVGNSIGFRIATKN